MTGAVRERRQVLRSRVARLRATHSYRTVLALILATFAFTSIASDATWTTSVLLLLQCLTLAAAIWTSGLARPHSPLVIALLVAGLGLACALLVWTRNGLVGAAGIMSAILVVATIVVIAIGVVDQNEVNAQSVTGAICIYILFGIAFLFVYSAMAILGSGDFFAQGTDGTRALRLYFSYVTLATLGYGDYTPAGNAGHSVAVLEALLGQVYLVTVVALLVSRLRVRSGD
jgi:ion channel